MPRLFTGIEIPPDIREGLAKLKTPLPGAKWVEPRDFHVTLRFAGDIEGRAAKEFVEFLGGIGAGVFEMRLSGLGAFGGNDPHALWAGAEAGSEFDALIRANERAARAAGLAPLKRPHKPHVTLARLRHSNPEAVARVLERAARFRSRPFIVERFVLFSAKPLTGGGPYVVEAAFPLAGSAFDDSFAEDGAW